MFCTFDKGNIIATNKKDNICYRSHHTNGNSVGIQSRDNLIKIIDQKIPNVFKTLNAMKNISNVVNYNYEDNTITIIYRLGHCMLVAKLNGNLYVFDYKERRREYFKNYKNIKYIPLSYDKNADRSGACVNAVDALLIELAKKLLKHEDLQTGIDKICYKLNTKADKIKVSDKINKIKDFIKKFDVKPNENGVYQIGNLFYDTKGAITKEKEQEIIHNMKNDNSLYKQDKDGHTKKSDNKEKKFVQCLLSEAHELQLKR